MPKKKLDLNDYIFPLFMNGLQGRMLRMPAPKNKKREILFIYGLHASLERQFGIAEFLNKYGAVTMPDLPGFGGMQSFYKIGEKPSIDNLADYLASFIKLRYKNKKVTIMAISFGFVVVTRMLQKYPDLAKKVELLVSVVGFVHHDEFLYKRHNKTFFRYVASFFSNRAPAWFCRNIILRPTLIRATYRHVAERHAKLKDADVAERDRRIDFEVTLWQSNDIRTYMDNLVSMFKLDLCTQQVNLPVHHVAVAHDAYFDNHLVSEHMKVIYSDVTVVSSRLLAHAPTVIADAKDAAGIIPLKIRRLLSQ
jgi:pimeloyl-ACP methyl ester carboxylesterase